MKWSELKPRERDGLVAWKVMGWKPFQALGEQPWQANLWNNPQGLACMRDVPDELAQGNEGVILPHYSTNMNAAWSLIKPEDEIILRNPIPNKWSCKILYAGFSWIGESETAQDAICIAKLRDAGVDIEP